MKRLKLHEMLFAYVRQQRSFTNTDWHIPTHRGRKIFLVLLLGSGLFTQFGLRADSLPVFVSASVTGVTLTVTLSGGITCPLGCSGFTLRVPNTSTTFPIISGGSPSGSTISN